VRYKKALSVSDDYKILGKAKADVDDIQAQHAILEKNLTVTLSEP